MVPQCAVWFEFWRCRIRKARELGMMQVGKRAAQDAFLVCSKERVAALQVYERVKGLVGDAIGMIVFCDTVLGLGSLSMAVL